MDYRLHISKLHSASKTKSLKLLSSTRTSQAICSVLAYIWSSLQYSRPTDQQSTLYKQNWSPAGMLWGRKSSPHEHPQCCYSPAEAVIDITKWFDAMPFRCKRAQWRGKSLLISMFRLFSFWYQHVWDVSSFCVISFFLCHLFPIVRFHEKCTGLIWFEMILI